MNLRVHEQIMSCCTIVFAKNPVPNQVKTRLRPLLSPEGAASLYRSFLVDWCNALSEITASDLVIAYTPPDGLRNLKTLIGGNAVYVPQGESGLGDRLTAVSQWACEHNYDKFLIVGSDSPTLPIAYVDEAIELLDSREIVVGPSTDGGYYLIGFSKRGAARTIPAIFEDIAWSTEHVFRRTLEKVETANAKLGLLPPWYDVDTPPELQFLRDHLFAMRLAECRVPIPRTERELEKWLG